MTVVVVGAALLDPVCRPGRLLVAQRARPPRLAGCWELPGGKVEPGESDRGALARECREELGVLVRVGDRVGPELAIGSGVLRAYAAYLDCGRPRALEHRAVAWVGAAELARLAWLPGDRLLLPALVGLLAT